MAVKMSYNLQEIVASMWKHRETKSFKQKDGLLNEYRDLKVKASIGGSGNLNCIPWISYCAKGQTTSNGIYPVLLFYGTKEFREKLQQNNKNKVIVLAYGISASNKPGISWGAAIEGKNKIETLFKELDYQANDDLLTVYNSSFIYNIYNWTDNLDYIQIQKDIDDLIDIYDKIIKGSNHVKIEGTTINQPSKNSDKEFSIKRIIECIKNTGLIYSDTLIKRFTYSLMAKPFVILSGLAGSGKTQLALAFAKCLCENFEEQVCTVSIGADWTNREPLLGYPNALKSGEYVMPESGVLQLIMQANSYPQ